MDAVSPDAKRRPIGTYAGVEIEAVAWDAVGARVDLSFGCMFTREVEDAGEAMLAGLLSALDGALNLTREEFATRPALKRLVFDAGAAHLDSVAASFRQAFDARRRSA